MKNHGPYIAFPTPEVNQENKPNDASAPSGGGESSWAALNIPVAEAAKKPERRDKVASNPRRQSAAQVAEVLRRIDPNYLDDASVKIIVAVVRALHVSDRRVSEKGFATIVGDWLDGAGWDRSQTLGVVGAVASIPTASLVSTFRKSRPGDLSKAARYAWGTLAIWSTLRAAVNAPSIPNLFDRRSITPEVLGAGGELREPILPKPQVWFAPFADAQTSVAGEFAWLTSRVKAWLLQHHADRYVRMIEAVEAYMTSSGGDDARIKHWKERTHEERLTRGGRARAWLEARLHRLTADRGGGNALAYDYRKNPAKAGAALHAAPVLIDSDTGVGKSYLTELLVTENPHLRVNLTKPTTVLAREAYASLVDAVRAHCVRKGLPDFSERIFLRSGMQAPDPEAPGQSPWEALPEDAAKVTRMCLRWSEIEAYAKSGGHASDLCKGCMFAKRCGYKRQERSREYRHAVVVVSAGLAQFTNPDKVMKARPPHLHVLDDATIFDLIETRRFKVKDLTVPTSNPLGADLEVDELKRVVAAIANWASNEQRAGQVTFTPGDVRSRVAEETGTNNTPDGAATILEKAAQQALDAKLGVNDLPVKPGEKGFMRDGETRDLLRFNGRMQRLFELVSALKPRVDGTSRKVSFAVETNASGECVIVMKRAAYVPKDVPVAILDGTGDDMLWSLAIGRAVDYVPQPRVELGDGFTLTQVTDSVGGITKFSPPAKGWTGSLATSISFSTFDEAIEEDEAEDELGDEEDAPGEGGGKGYYRSLKQIHRLALWDVAHNPIGGELVVSGYKRSVEALSDMDRDGLYERFSMSKGRGLNRYKGHRRMIVFGRPAVPAADLIMTASAISGEAIEIEDYGWRTGWVNTTGGWAPSPNQEFLTHPVAEALRVQAVLAVLYQVINRLRQTRRLDELIEVLVLTRSAIPWVRVAKFTTMAEALAVADDFHRVLVDLVPASGSEGLIWAVAGKDGKWLNNQLRTDRGDNKFAGEVRQRRLAGLQDCLASPAGLGAGWSWWRVTVDNQAGYAQIRCAAGDTAAAIEAIKRARVDVSEPAYGWHTKDGVSKASALRKAEKKIQIEVEPMSSPTGDRGVDTSLTVTKWLPAYKEIYMGGEPNCNREESTAEAEAGRAVTLDLHEIAPTPGSVEDLIAPIRRNFGLIFDLTVKGGTWLAAALLAGPGAARGQIETLAATIKIALHRDPDAKARLIKRAGLRPSTHGVRHPLARYGVEVFVDPRSTEATVDRLQDQFKCRVLPVKVRQQAADEPEQAPAPAPTPNNNQALGVDVTTTAAYVAPGVRLVLYPNAPSAAWGTRVTMARFLATMTDAELAEHQPGDIPADEHVVILEMARTIRNAANSNTDWGREFICEGDVDVAV